MSDEAFSGNEHLEISCCISPSSPSLDSLSLNTNQALKTVFISLSSCSKHTMKSKWNKCCSFAPIYAQIQQLQIATFHLHIHTHTHTPKNTHIHTHTYTYTYIHNTFVTFSKIHWFTWPNGAWIGGYFISESSNVFHLAWLWLHMFISGLIWTA